MFGRRRDPAAVAAVAVAEVGAVVAVEVMEVVAVAEVIEVVAEVAAAIVLRSGSRNGAWCRLRCGCARPVRLARRRWTRSGRD